jgi:hypothetical protein
MIQKDCIPANEAEMVCEVTGGPSTDGKYEFSLYWLTDYNPSAMCKGAVHPDATRVGDLFVRGQNFHCEPGWYRDRCLSQGLIWREVDRRSGKAAV